MNIKFVYANSMIYIFQKSKLQNRKLNLKTVYILNTIMRQSRENLNPAT